MLEIERKFLVVDDSYKQLSYSSSHIQQGYICSERGRTVRVRIRDERAYLTIKGPSENGGLSRYEFEREIPLEDGKQMMYRYLQLRPQFFHPKNSMTRQKLGLKKNFSKKR